MRHWKTGDKCMITCEGRTVEGSVIFASGNGKSLMLEFEAILFGMSGSGAVGMLPVLLGDDEIYRSIVDQTEITLEEMK